jgi:hypothetical protein
MLQRRHGTSMFETGDGSQVIGKYLDRPLEARFVPAPVGRACRTFSGFTSTTTSRDFTFKLNDILLDRSSIPDNDRLRFRLSPAQGKKVRPGHCLEHWGEQEKTVLRVGLAKTPGAVRSRCFCAAGLFCSRTQPAVHVDFDLFGYVREPP